MCGGYVEGRVAFKGRVGERIGVSDTPKVAELRKLLCTELCEDGVTNTRPLGSPERGGGPPLIPFSPVLHNPGEVSLQFVGWSITLREDGTWYWSDTSGG